MRTLRQGDRNPDVVTWQRIIGVPADGIFGVQTTIATRVWQRSRKLQVDGVVGPETWKAAGLEGDPVGTEHWPAQIDCDEFYGNPRGSNGNASSAWENDNLVRYVPPWQMVDEDSGKPISGITVHKKCRDSLARVFDRAWTMYGKSQSEINKRHLNLFSGSYVFRNIRGSSRLSMHAYGCAIDIAAGLNELGKPYDPQRGLPMDFVKLFEDEGWTWGGRWTGRPDAMHFQAAYVSRSDIPEQAPQPAPQPPLSPAPPPSGEAAVALSSGKGSWYSQYDGKYHWGDNEDDPGSNALGVPDDCQGISFLDHSTLGKWFEVHAPNGKVSIEQQTEIGPALWTGRKIDISAVCAERMGYSPATFPTDAPWKWRPVPPPAEVVHLSPHDQAIKYKQLRGAVA